MRSLRLTTSHGEIVREPDRAAVDAAVKAAGRLGPATVVVLDGDTDPEAPFVQATKIDELAWRIEIWRVEARSAREHYRTFVAGDDAVTDVFWSWATGSDGWQQLRWQAAERPLAATG